MKTTCSVTAKNALERVDLIMWLENIGRMYIHTYDTHNISAITHKDCTQIKDKHGIDCGENIEMFKALAAMNSDNDWEQWFVADCIMKFDVLKGHVKTESGRRIIYPGEWFKVLVPHIGNVRAKWMSLYRPKFLSHKASKDEIIEHYNGKKR
jgi:hypothetical protein